MDINEVTHWITAKRERVEIRHMGYGHLLSCKFLLEDKTATLAVLELLIWYLWPNDS